ncbi:hypothetical protein ACFW04_003496 [Cataglyphis niger]
MELGSGESSRGGIDLRKIHGAMTKMEKFIANQRTRTVPCVRVEQMHSKRNLADASSAIQNPGIGSSQLPEIDRFRATNGSGYGSLHVHMEEDRRARKRTHAAERCSRDRNRTHAQPPPCFQK